MDASPRSGGRPGARQAPSGQGARVVEAGWVRMGPTGRLVRVASEEARFFRNDVLMVRTERGDLLGKAIADSERAALAPDRYCRVVRRVPTAEAANLEARDEARRQEARQAFVELVRSHELDMHLSEIETFCGEPRILFYFTAPGRVDFRGMVRDLATRLRARIELRQVGVRDEARCTGGLGPCGQPLCCATFLREFTAVTIRMAKVQGLVPNPQKVSGLCGRLMCCLAYEHDVYLELMKAFPKVGAVVKTSKGEGKVKELQIMRGLVKVSLGPGQFVDVPLDEILPPGGSADGAGESAVEGRAEARESTTEAEAASRPAKEPRPGAEGRRGRRDGGDRGGRRGRGDSERRGRPPAADPDPSKG